METTTRSAAIRINFEEQHTYPVNKLIQNISVVANELIFLTNLSLDEGWDSFYISSESPFSKRITKSDLVQVCIKGFDIEVKNCYNEHKSLEKYEFIITPSETTDSYMKIADTYFLPIDYLHSLLYKRTKEYEEALKNPDKFTEDYFQLLIEESVYLEKTINFLYSLMEGEKVKIEQGIINFIISLL